MIREVVVIVRIPVCINSAGWRIDTGSFENIKERIKRIILEETNKKVKELAAGDMSDEGIIKETISPCVSENEIKVQIENLLKGYFKSDKQKEKGLPTVKYLAEHVHLSASYLSDLLKKETGMNAQDQIHYYLIEEAKNILQNSDNSVSEIAYSLGFEYPQYFSKLFKQKTGQTPVEYRNLN